MLDTERKRREKLEVAIVKKEREAGFNKAIVDGVDELNLPELEAYEKALVKLSNLMATRTNQQILPKAMAHRQLQLQQQQVLQFSVPVKQEISGLMPGANAFQPLHTGFGFHHGFNGIF